MFPHRGQKYSAYDGIDKLNPPPSFLSWCCTIDITSRFCPQTKQENRLRLNEKKESIYLFGECFSIDLLPPLDLEVLPLDFLVFARQPLDRVLVLVHLLSKESIINLSD